MCAAVVRIYMYARKCTHTYLISPPIPPSDLPQHTHNAHALFPAPTTHNGALSFYTKYNPTKTSESNLRKVGIDEPDVV